MGKITVVNRGTAKDLPAFRAVADEAIAIVESDLPGTLIYEFYVDEETSRFVWNEAYADSAAMLKHAQRLMGAGIMERVPELVDFDFAVALGEVSDEIRETFGGMGFEFYQPHAAARH